jgi:hypothetical protein
MVNFIPGYNSIVNLKFLGKYFIKQYIISNNIYFNVLSSICDFMVKNHTHNIMINTDAKTDENIPFMTYNNSCICIINDIPTFLKPFEDFYNFMEQKITENNKLTLDEYYEVNEEDDESDTGIEMECGNKKSLLQKIANKLLN